MITRKMIEGRRTALLVDRARISANIEQLKATFEATHGAIQDCEYWLQQIEPETVSESEAEAPED